MKIIEIWKVKMFMILQQKVMCLSSEVLLLNYSQNDIRKHFQTSLQLGNQDCYGTLPNLKKKKRVVHLKVYILKLFHLQVKSIQIQIKAIYVIIAYSLQTFMSFPSSLFPQDGRKYLLPTVMPKFMYSHFVSGFSFLPISFM